MGTACASKRERVRSGGEKEIQRTMLELLNQLDGFDDRNDVKVIMATNKVRPDGCSMFPLVAECDFSIAICIFISRFRRDSK